MDRCGSFDYTRAVLEELKTEVRGISFVDFFWTKARIAMAFVCAKQGMM